MSGANHLAKWIIDYRASDLRFVFPCGNTGEQVEDVEPPPCNSCKKNEACVEYFTVYADRHPHDRKVFEVFEAKEKHRFETHGG